MLTLFTSGSTDEPKRVTHSWEYINQSAKLSAKEIGLTKDDIVLDVFPANTIAHYTITAFPAYISGAQLVSANFNALTYPTLFSSVKPTYIALIPRHLELLQKTKGFKDLDMSCVRYMVTGSSKIEQSFIDAFKERGVQTVANWYGMTEYAPPVMIGYDSPSFDFNTIDEKRTHVMFNPITATSNLAHCIINGKSTGDIFDMNTKTFSHRMNIANGKTWKNEF
jgi:acyl-coenzyme A synthetase/AMP-(fatty) acid ligase